MSGLGHNVGGAKGGGAEHTERGEVALAARRVDGVVGRGLDASDGDSVREVGSGVDSSSVDRDAVARLSSRDRLAAGNRDGRGGAVGALGVTVLSVSDGRTGNGLSQRRVDLLAVRALDSEAGGEGSRPAVGSVVENWKNQTFEYG